LKDCELRNHFSSENSHSYNTG